jgi:hypothetical protein
VNGPDGTLLRVSPAQRVPRVGHRSGQCRLADEPTPPDLVEELLLWDHAVAVLREVQQQLQYTRLKAHRKTRAAQFEALAVELEFPEPKVHEASLGYTEVSKGVFG